MIDDTLNKGCKDYGYIAVKEAFRFVLNTDPKPKSTKQKSQT